MTVLSPPCSVCAASAGARCLPVGPEAAVHGSAGAAKDVEVSGKDTLSNSDLLFQRQTQVPFPHTNFRGLGRSDSFLLGGGGGGRETGELELFKA